MSMRVRNPLGVMLLLAVGGCESEGLRAVRRYNEAVIDAYRTGEISHLGDVATAEEVERVRRRILLKKADGVVLESALERLEELSSSAPAVDGLIVETRELWRYHDRSLVPGRPRGVDVVAEMTMRYELESLAGPWRVIKVRTLTNRYLAPADYRPGGEPHGRVPSGEPEREASKVFVAPPGAPPDSVWHGTERPPPPKE